MNNLRPGDSFDFTFHHQQTKYTLKMKKNVLILSAFCLSGTGLWAQATPNASFENWTHSSFPSYDTPDNWSCANSQTALTGVYSCLKGTSAHTGSYSVELITKNIGSPINQLVPGVVTTGTLPSSSSGSITGGIAYNLRPDSITGWYKYSPQGGENGFISFDLFGAGGMSDTIAKASFATPKVAVGSWTRFSAPLVYRSVNAVVNSIWLLSSSNNDGLAGSVGSTLYADDLGLVLNPNGIAEHTNPEVTVGPNPASDYIVLRNAFGKKVLFVLYDVTGAKVAEEQSSGAVVSISLTTLPAGLYIYSITDETGGAAKTGKLVIRK
jgi:hypothetical protein